MKVADLYIYEFGDWLTGLDSPDLFTSRGLYRDPVTVYLQEAKGQTWYMRERHVFSSGTDMEPNLAPTWATMFLDELYLAHGFSWIEKEQAIQALNRTRAKLELAPLETERTVTE